MTETASTILSLQDVGFKIPVASKLRGHPYYLAHKVSNDAPGAKGISKRYYMEVKLSSSSLGLRDILNRSVK
ncbi:hypothetical protein BYT27DRAFT_6613620 [Phlegmacium glaucopus]|nr:hypothetical protein BYT27DRAFT_6613620 [Phlegmacium glaucopus]